jgi:hypothetical protein
MPEKYSTEQWFLALGKKFRELEDRIVYLEEKTGHKLPVPQTNGQNSGNPDEPVAKKEDCFYFAGVSNGSFSGPSTEPSDKSLYRFVKIDENKARVYVVNSPTAIVRIKNSPDSHEAACEIEKQSPDKPFGIETIEPGEADYDGNGTWTIRIRVKIKFLG